MVWKILSLSILGKILRHALERTLRILPENLLLKILIMCDLTLIRHLSRSQHRDGVHPFDFTSVGDQQRFWEGHINRNTASLDWSIQGQNTMQEGYQTSKSLQEGNSREDEVMSASADPEGRAPVVSMGKEVGQPTPSQLKGQCHLWVLKAGSGLLP